MLVYFEPAKLCEAHGDVVLAPLPAQKQLWEATDERTWKLQSKSGREMQVEFGLTKNGDLVELKEYRMGLSERATMYSLTASPKKTAKWNEWCSGMDGIGGLVMLAASLIR